MKAAAYAESVTIVRIPQARLTQIDSQRPKISGFVVGEAH
jgi:hypothetical protein